MPKHHIKLVGNNQYARVRKNEEQGDIDEIAVIAVPLYIL